METHGIAKKIVWMNVLLFVYTDMELDHVERIISPLATLGYPTIKEVPRRTCLSRIDSRFYATLLFIDYEIVFEAISVQCSARYYHDIKKAWLKVKHKTQTHMPNPLAYQAVRTERKVNKHKQTMSKGCNQSICMDTRRAAGI